MFTKSPCLTITGMRACTAVLAELSYNELVDGYEGEDSFTTTPCPAPQSQECAHARPCWQSCPTLNKWMAMRVKSVLPRALALPHIITGMRACTAVLAELSYNEQVDGYVGEVEFMTVGVSLKAFC